MKKPKILLLSTILLLIFLGDLSSIRHSFQENHQSAGKNIPFFFPIDQKSQEISFSTTPQSRTINSSTLEIFFNEYIPTQMQQYNIPGAAIAVVSNNQTLFSKGYGFSNISSSTLMDPYQTIFPVGSISPLFTWTALMQLFEQGDLDLTKDIREYLENTMITLTTLHNDSITTLDLMGHAAGFEETIIGDEAISSETTLDLESYLETYAPIQLYEPGTVMAYSNYGVTLSGFILELLTNSTFSDYMEQNIFTPLNMSSSTFENLFAVYNPVDHLAQGYAYDKDDLDDCIKTLPNYLNIVPASGLFSTVEDMGHFMQAHLNSGMYNNQSLLNNESIIRMHTPHFNMKTQSTGWAHGFMTKKYHNLTWIGHSGEISGHTSDLNLILDENIGVFITYNSEKQDEAIKRFFQDFLTEFLPLSIPPILTSPNITRNELRRFKGNFRTTRRVESNIFQIYHLFDRDLHFSINSDGYLVLNKEITFSYTDSLRFRAVDSEYYIEFLEDGDGSIAFVVFENIHSAFMKVAFTEIQGIHYSWAIAATLAVLSGLVVPPLIILKNRKNRKVMKNNLPDSSKLNLGNESEKTNQSNEKQITPNQDSKDKIRKFRSFRKKRIQKPQLSIRSYQISSFIFWIVSISLIIYLICMIFFFQKLDWAKTGGFQGFLRFMLAFLLLIRTIAFFNLVLLINSWIDRFWSWQTRVYYFLLMFNQLSLMLWLYYWKIFGFNI